MSLQHEVQESRGKCAYPPCDQLSDEGSRTALGLCAEHTKRLEDQMFDVWASQFIQVRAKEHVSVARGPLSNGGVRR